MRESRIGEAFFIFPVTCPLNAGIFIIPYDGGIL